MRFGRREFLERVFVSACVLGVRPWEWATWLYPHDEEKAVDALRAWDEIGEGVAMAATVPSSHIIKPPTVLGASSLSGIASHGTSGGDGTWNLAEDSGYVRPSGLTSTMLRIDRVSPGTVQSGYRIDWNINMVGSNVRVLDIPIKVVTTTTSANVTVLIYLSDTSGFANYWYYQTDVPLVGSQSEKEAYVSAVRHLPSGTVGSPNASMTFTRVRARVLFNAGQVGSVYVGPLLLNGQEKSFVSFTFDDTNLNDYTYGYLYMAPKGVKGSSCVNSTFGTLSREKMVEMAVSNKWSIHNHTARHLDLVTLNADSVRDEVVECRDFLQEFNLDLTNMFIPPFGSINSLSRDIIYNYYKYIVITDGSSVGFRTYDGFPERFKISRVGIDSSVSLSTMLGYLSNAVSRNHSICFGGHNPNPTPISGGHVDSDDLQKLVDVVARYNNVGMVECVTLDEMMSKMTTRRQIRF
jgi:peptidoglycan/xylan/chitin deacetylase (PgdA/CDA1 family)